MKKSDISDSSIPQFLNSSIQTIFSVNIIPHTTKVTGFSRLKVGDAVNLEIDMLARYVARLTEAKRA